MDNYSSQFEQSTHYSQFGSSSQSIISNYNHQQIYSLMNSILKNPKGRQKYQKQVHIQLQQTFEMLSSPELLLAKELHPLFYLHIFFTSCKDKKFTDANISAETIQEQCESTIASIKQFFQQDENDDGQEFNYMFQANLVQNQQLKELQAQASSNIKDKINYLKDKMKQPTINIICFYYLKVVKYLIKMKFISSHQISFMKFLIKSLKQFCKDYKKLSSDTFCGGVKIHKNFKKQQQRQQKSFEVNKKKSKKQKKVDKKDLNKLLGSKSIKFGSIKLPQIKTQKKIILNSSNSSQESLKVDNLSKNISNVSFQEEEDKKQKNEYVHDAENTNLVSQLKKEQNSKNQQANQDNFGQQDVEDLQYAESEQQQ